MSVQIPPVIGHRGAASRAPENTLAGLRAAAALAVRMVEFDAKLSADGVPVLMHDDTLNRTTDGRGAVRDTPWTALSLLDAGGWFGSAFAGEPVPTLSRALETCLELGLTANIEIKPCPGRDADTALTVVEMVRRVWPEDRPAPLISSFSETALSVAREVAPWAPRGLLMVSPPADWSDPVRRLEPATVHLDRRAVTAGVVADLSARGLPVLAYTVNETEIAAKLFGMGVTAVFSDVPDEVAQAVPVER